MVIVSITFIIFIHSLMKVSTFGEIYDETDEIRCSNVFDPVCGMTKASDGIPLIEKYQNICHFTKTKYEINFMYDLQQIPDEDCNIKKKNRNGRRLNDFSIVGAHEACNHTCPTYCVDTYAPACAQIWKRDMEGFVYRPMINHCHIDLFSCALGVNVTIHSLGRCYKNPAGLLFMSQVAGLKSLKLLDDTHIDYRVSHLANKVINRRRYLDINEPSTP